jgi:tRNA (guanine10-N2)-dimethyltransferase
VKLLCELSGEHPDLPFIELSCIGEIVERRPQAAVVSCEEPGTAVRLALCHCVMEHLGSCAASQEDLQEMLGHLAIRTDRSFAARVKKVQGSEMEASQLELERLIGSGISGKVSLKEPQEEYRLLCSEDLCYLGRVLCRPDRGSFESRNPMRRSFFHPGVMMPRLARALVNISQVQPGELLYDPFCGTGGILLEASLVGARMLGSDFDPSMVAGCRENLDGADLMLSDAASLPIRDGSIDAVVTDLPYGQSVRIHAATMHRLYHESLGEIRRVLAPGRRAVVVTHTDIKDIAQDHFANVDRYEQRVHKSLTRRIMVLW